MKKFNYYQQHVLHSYPGHYAQSSDEQDTQLYVVRNDTARIRGESISKIIDIVEVDSTEKEIGREPIKEDHFLFEPITQAIGDRHIPSGRIPRIIWDPKMKKFFVYIKEYVKIFQNNELADIL